MAECCTEDAPASITFRLWTPSFRKRLFEVFACGGGGGRIGIGTCSSSRRCRREKWNREIESVGVGGLSGSSTEEKDSGSENDRRKKLGSEKLSDFLNIPCAEKTAAEDRDLRRKKETEELKRIVTMLTGGVDEREKVAEAASEVRRLAKDDSSARSLLAVLGAIPPLVGMIGSESDDDDASNIAALYALVNLGIGNDINKAAIVKAGAVHKMLSLIQGPNRNLGSAVSDAIVANFLCLSALDSNKPIIGSSGAIPFLVSLLKDKDSSSFQSRQDSMRALFNLTICNSNVSYVLETDLIEYLMNVMGNMEVSERGLAILSNVVSTPEGRKAISAVRDTFYILVDVMSWTDAPGCQEKAAYILMVMSHKAYGDRRAMVDAGVVSALLELTLMGTTLAQKRASRILEFLRVDKGKQISESFSNVHISAPIHCYASSGSSGMQPTPTKLCYKQGNLTDGTSSENKAVKQLVQQSLQNNMRRIVKRANLPNDYVPSDHFKCLTLSSTSKSLPF